MQSKPLIKICVHVFSSNHQFAEGIFVGVL